MQTDRPGSLPTIFHYTDFRAYLADYQAARKAVDRKFSHRFIADKVGSSSSGWFSDIVRGRISLTGAFRVRLARILNLKEREADYFEVLVNLDQAGSEEEREACARRIMSFREVPSELVGRDRFEYYSAWYYGAIRELLFFHDFKGDYAALASLLVPAISVPEAKRAIALLQRLGFVAKDAQGCLRPAKGALKKDSAIKADNLSTYMKKNMELAMTALDAYSREDRDISALTLSFSGPGFVKAKEEIRALRKKLLALMVEDNFPEKVYQCNIQMFPITR